MTDSAQTAAAPQPIPPEIDRWNWGAFLLNWIWGIGNGTPIALLALVPLVGFVMLFVLGAKGSRWAWRNKRWDSVEHFKRVHSEAYQMGIGQLQSSPLVTNAFGTPITTGNPTGSISTENANGKASLTFSVSGPKGSGTAFVEAIKKDGVWSLTRLAYKRDGSDSVIEIIGGARNST
jgi:hypothetical protein